MILPSPASLCTGNPYEWPLTIARNDSIAPRTKVDTQLDDVETKVDVVVADVAELKASVAQIAEDQRRIKAMLEGLLSLRQPAALQDEDS